MVTVPIWLLWLLIGTMMLNGLALIQAVAVIRRILFGKGKP